MRLRNNARVKTSLLEFQMTNSLLKRTQILSTNGHFQDCFQNEMSLLLEMPVLYIELKHFFLNYQRTAISRTVSKLLFLELKNALAQKAISTFELKKQNDYFKVLNDVAFQ